MFAFAFPLEHEDEFLAQVTEIAYRTVLRHGLRRPFLEVELELWRQIRTAYHAQEVNHVILEDEYLAQVTSIVCQAISRFWRDRSLIVDESSIWQQIRAAYQSLTTPDDVLTEVV